jgi:hypothetical protein
VRETFFGVLIAASVGLLSLILFLSLPHVQQNAGVPVLSGSPQITLLSLLGALALYLRHVHVSVLEAIYKIRHGELWEKAPHLNHRKEKLYQLHRTSQTIIGVAPFMFMLILVLCARVIYDTHSHFYTPSSEEAEAIHKADYILAVWVGLMFGGLTAAHFVVRFDDDALQASVWADDAKDRSVPDDLRPYKKRPPRKVVKEQF